MFFPKYADESLVQGYDSLQSTPKQQQPAVRPAEKVELESNNDTEENVSNTSLDNSIRWMDSFFLLKNCKIFNRIHLRARPDDEKMSAVDDQSAVGEVTRVEWDKKMDFLLSIIGFAVDLANVSIDAAERLCSIRLFLLPGLPIPVPVLPERRRGLPHPLYSDAAVWSTASLLYGACTRTVCKSWSVSSL